MSALYAIQRVSVDLPLAAGLAAWLPGLDRLRAAHKGVIRWAVDIDPLAI